MKNKIDVIIGVGKLKPGKLDVTDENNKVTEYSADHIILLLALAPVNYLTYHKMVKSNWLP
jgi:hypothetical protein